VYFASFQKTVIVSLNEEVQTLSYVDEDFIEVFPETNRADFMVRLVRLGQVVHG